MSPPDIDVVVVILSCDLLTVVTLLKIQQTKATRRFRKREIAECRATPAIHVAIRIIAHPISREIICVKILHGEVVTAEERRHMIIVQHICIEPATRAVVAAIPYSIAPNAMLVVYQR